MQLQLLMMMKTKKAEEAVMEEVMEEVMEVEMEVKKGE